MSSPIEIVMSYYCKGGGGVTRAGVIVNQMATEVSAVSLDNGQTCLTNYFEILVWHLTPRWKIILMGSDPIKIISSLEIIFAWFDLCQKYMVFA